ncbi:hypothetical protein MNB_SV-13-806 [hydrothermal vent metagenome]|uniref:Lipoprotein n=1 Tax=hydrothermal vent metagenome TaxID=652676 RepID=A0A1W1CRM4_9ZZZZ
MPQNLKKLFSSISLLFFLFFTGCMSRQNNAQYIRPHSYNNPYYYKTPPKQKIYRKRASNYTIQEATPKIKYIFSKHRTKKESTFEKILRQSKQKKLKLKKRKYNSCREDFPSNVPRGSIQ